MSCAQYYVSRTELAWKVRVGNAEFNYKTRVTAMKAALGAAIASSANGYDAEVLTEGEDGDWQTEWRYSRVKAGVQPSVQP